MGAPRRQPAAPPRTSGGPAEPEIETTLPESDAQPSRCRARHILLAGLIVALGLNVAALAVSLSTRGGALGGAEILLAAATLVSGSVLLLLVELGRRSDRRRSSR